MAAAAAALVDMRIHLIVSLAVSTVCGGTIAANMVDEDEAWDAGVCGCGGGCWLGAAGRTADPAYYFRFQR